MSELKRLPMVELLDQEMAQETELDHDGEILAPELSYEQTAEILDKLLASPSTETQAYTHYLIKLASEYRHKLIKETSILVVTILISLGAGSMSLAFFYDAFFNRVGREELGSSLAVVEIFVACFLLYLAALPLEKALEKSKKARQQQIRTQRAIPHLFFNKLGEGPIDDTNFDAFVVHTKRFASVKKQEAERQAAEAAKRLASEQALEAQRAELAEIEAEALQSYRASKPSEMEV